MSDKELLVREIMFVEALLRHGLDVDVQGKIGVHPTSNGKFVVWRKDDEQLCDTPKEAAENLARIRRAEGIPLVT